MARHPTRSPVGKPLVFRRSQAVNAYVFLIYRQTLKLQIPDYNGDQKTFPLGPTFTFKQSSTAGNLSPTTIEIK